LEALHQVSKELIRFAYDSIDDLYRQVASILDKHGITIQARMLYRCFAEEMWKLHESYRGKTLMKMNEAITRKYVRFGLDPDVLNEIRGLFPMPYKLHVDVYVVASLVKVGEGDIVVGEVADIYADGEKVGEIYVGVTPITASVYVDFEEVGRFEA